MISLNPRVSGEQSRPETQFLLLLISLMLSCFAPSKFGPADFDLGKWLFQITGLGWHVVLIS